MLERFLYSPSRQGQALIERFSHRFDGKEHPSPPTTEVPQGGEECVAMLLPYSFQD